MKYLIFILFSIVILSSSFAQEEKRYTEEEIAVQGKFIKATQKKLIGKIDEAISIYEEILKTDKNNGLALFDLSRIYLEKDEKDQAINYGEKAVKWVPDNSWYQESLAEIYYHFEEYASSGKAYRQLIETGEKDRVLYYEAQDAFEKAGDEQSALAILKMLEDKYGMDEYSVQETTRILLNQEKNKEALEKAGKLMKIYPGNLQYILLNAQLQSDFGSKKMAQSLYEKALQIDPSNSDALVYLATKSDNGGALSKVRSIIMNKAVDIDTKVQTLIPYAEKITSKHIDKNTLIELSNQLAMDHPEEAKAYALHGDMLYNSGDLINAEVNYLKALEIDKSVFAIWQQVMIIQDELKKYKDLKDITEKAFDYYPNQVAPYIFHGLALIGIGDVEEVDAMLSEVAIIGTKDPFLKRKSAILKAQVKALRNGEEILELTREDLFARGLKPEDPSVVTQLGENLYLVTVKSSAKRGNP